MIKDKNEEKTYKVRTPFNYVPEKGKKTVGLSKTVPSQALSLRDIMDKHTRGIPVNVGINTPIYEDEENPTNGIHPKSLDLADIEQLKRENAEYIKKLKLRKNEEDKEAETQRVANRKKQLEKQQEELIEALRKKQEKL